MFDYLHVCGLVRRAAVNSGLEAFAVASEIELELDELRKANLKLANEQFAAMPAPERKKERHGAMFKPYSRPAQYEWPQPVLDAERALADARERAKADGTAKVVERAFDFESDRMFSVQVLARPAPSAAKIKEVMAGAMVYVDAKMNNKKEVPE
jgi:hypothetical protein